MEQGLLMNIIVLPTELTNLSVNDNNVQHLIYSLGYYFASECINKNPENNAALEYVIENEGIGGASDSIYDKFIPLSQANLAKEKEVLGFEFNVNNPEYSDYFIASEIVYNKWYDILRFEQRLDYKIRSLIDFHGVPGSRIDILLQDCNELPFKDRAIYGMSLMADLWDSNHYALSDDNVIWGVGYSEFGAFFNAMENHFWLEKNYNDINIENENLKMEGSNDLFLDGIVPYDNSTALFTEILSLMKSKKKDWYMPNNLELSRCTPALFAKVDEGGLTDFDFCEKVGFLDILE